jgi:hypothetical protein
MNKTFIKILSGITFVIMMVFNITTTLNGYNFSLSGINANAKMGVTCYSTYEHCGWFGDCYSFYLCGQCPTRVDGDNMTDSGTC